MTIFVAPTEPPSLRAIGVSNLTLTEHFGVDFLIPVPEAGLLGVQRKTVQDFLASLMDGRLSHDVLRMTELPIGVLLMEGIPRWGVDGLLVGVSNEDDKSIPARNFRRESFWGLVLSLQLRGIFFMNSVNMTETADMLRYMETWAGKGRHDSLTHRPKPSRNVVMTRKDWAIHLLQSFKGVGSEVAGRVFDHYSGLPLAWTVSEKEMQEVPGVGKKRAREMFEMLEKVGSSG